MTKLTTIGEKVRHLRASLGLSQQQLAVQAGVTQQSIDAIEGGRTKRPRSIVDIARVLGVSAEMLTNDGAPIETSEVGSAGGRARNPVASPSADPAVAMAADAPDLPDLRRLPQDVPVLGTAEGGTFGDFLLNGETIDYLRRPAGIARARDVFAIYVTGASMYPRFNEGEPVYVSTTRPPAVGDDVILEMVPQQGNASGAGFIKRLVRRTPTKIVVEQFNPASEIEFDRAEVKALYRIIPWSELLGI